MTGNGRSRRVAGEPAQPGRLVSLSRSTIGRATPFSRSILLLSGVVAIIAVARLIVVICAGTTGADYFAVWIAGAMWSAGLDPYGPDFLSFGVARLHRDFSPLFLYPPQWWLIAKPFGLLDPFVGRTVWNWCNLVLLIASVGIAGSAARSLRSPPPFWLILLTLAGAATMQSTSWTFFNGQTTFFVFAGFAIFLWGATADSKVVMGCGLALLLLKPQMGIPIALASLTQRRLRVPVVIGGMLTALLCLPFLVAVGADGALKSMAGLLAGLRAYGGNWANAPRVMLGPDQLLVLIGTRSQPFVAMLAAAIALAVCFSLEGVRRRPELFWIASIAILPLIVALHDYDLVFLSLVLLLLPSLGTMSRVLAVAGFVLLSRSNAIMRPFHTAEPTVWQARVDMIGIILIAAILAVELRRRASDEAGGVQADGVPATVNP